MTAAVNDVLRIVAKMSLGIDDVQNVFHAKCIIQHGTPTDAQIISDLANTLDTAYDYLDGVQPSDLSYDTISVYNLTQDYFMGEVAWPSLTAGASASTVPPQCAALVLFNTDTLKSQGRKYLPPFGGGAIDNDGTVTSAVLAYITSWAAEFIGTVIGTYMDVEYGNWNDTKSRWVPWVLAIIRDFFATQKSRYLGAGT